MNDKFVESLSAIPWFANLGKPISPDSNTEQIFGWNQWPGPEDESVSEIHLRHQSLYDTLLGGAEDKLVSAEELWKRIHDAVFRAACQKVPYDSTEDAWHAPSTAVWQAAWTAGLIGICLFLGHKIPDDLEEQWKWYREGHWPCALKNAAGNERLVVY